MTDQHLAHRWTSRPRRLAALLAMALTGVLAGSIAASTVPEAATAATPAGLLTKVSKAAGHGV